MLHFIGDVQSAPLGGGRKHAGGCPALGGAVMVHRHVIAFVWDKNVLRLNRAGGGFTTL